MSLHDHDALPDETALPMPDWTMGQLRAVLLGRNQNLRIQFTRVMRERGVESGTAMEWLDALNEAIARLDGPTT